MPCRIKGFVVIGETIQYLSTLRGLRSKLDRINKLKGIPIYVMRFSSVRGVAPGIFFCVCSSTHDMIPHLFIPGVISRFNV